MKRVLILAVFLAGGMLFFGFDASASGPPVRFYEPATVFFEDFEGDTEIAHYDHLFTGHEADITTENAISGTQSLTTYVVNAPGQWVDTLAIKKDFTQIEGANAFLVTGKIQTSNYQQMMVEVRKNYDGNTVENMPYEFILTINEANKTVQRPCFNGWYNACTTLDLHNELFSIDSEGVIDFEFEFSSDEPVTFTFRGVIADINQVAVMTFDDLGISEKPVMTEDFEVVMGNFWEGTAFWANAGGIETDPVKVVSGTQSLRYDINDWVLGGITNTKFQPPQEVPLKLTFEVRAVNGKVFLMATPWSPLYFEFQYDFETNVLSHPGLAAASATMIGDVLHAEMFFTVPASVDLQTFNFYGSKLNGEAPGHYILDNFAVEVLEKDPMVVPEFNVGYAITKTEAMAYRTNLLAADILSVSLGEEILDESAYVLTDYGFAFQNAYLDGLEAQLGLEFTLETTYGTHVILLDLYDVRPIVVPDSLVYQKSLQQNVALELDLVDHAFVSLSLNGALIGQDKYVIEEDSLVLDAALFLALENGEHLLSVISEGGTRTLSVTVETGGPAVLEASYDYQKGVDNDLDIGINLTSDHITGISVSETPLQPVDYTLSEGILTLNDSFLMTLPAGLTEFTIETSTPGITFDFSVNVMVFGPITDVTSVTYDVHIDDILEIIIDLNGMAITTVLLDDVTLESGYEYILGALELDASVFSNLAIGTYTLSISTAGGTVEIDLSIVNSAFLNDVIIITVPSSVVTITKGATYDPLADITHSNAVGDVTVSLSDHLNVNTPGRYVVTVVISDEQGNTSFAYYVVRVSGVLYSVTITYDILTKERGVIDEAILDSDRKHHFSF